MIYRLKILALCWCALFAPGFAFAGVEQISEKEFRTLALELAQKVPLFAEAWKQDPKAEFYGGTSRDYLYWLKGKFREANTPAEAQKIAKALRAERGSTTVTSSSPKATWISLLPGRSTSPPMN